MGLRLRRSRRRGQERALSQPPLSDPADGGNAGRVGWEAIGFPGPESLLATQDCTYGHKDKFLTDFDWADLIPHLRDKAD